MLTSCRCQCITVSASVQLAKPGAPVLPMPPLTPARIHTGLLLVASALKRAGDASCPPQALKQLWVIYSSGFQKRDGGRKDTETLVSRLVDRCLRPVFQKGWANETQVLSWVYSYDGVHSAEPLAITAASAALAISGMCFCSPLSADAVRGSSLKTLFNDFFLCCADIPASKVVAGVRVGLLPGEGFVVNPTEQQMDSSQLDLVIAGTSSAVLMIEGYCDFLTEDQMLEVVIKPGSLAACVRTQRALLGSASC